MNERLFKEGGPISVLNFLWVLKNKCIHNIHSKTILFLNILKYTSVNKLHQRQFELRPNSRHLERTVKSNTFQNYSV